MGNWLHRRTDAKPSPITTMTIKRPPSHAIGDAGERLFPNLLPDTCIPQKQVPDYGVDYLVQLAEAHMVTGIRFGCQVKTRERHPRVGEDLRVAIETAHLHHWLEVEQIPIFLVAIDRADGVGYFLDVDDVVKGLPKGWKDQKKITLSIPRTNTLGDRTTFIARVRAAWGRRMGPAASVARRKREYEQLDPRFTATVTLTEGGERVDLRALVNVACTVNVRVAEKRERLLRGDLVAFEPGEFSFSGTRLLEAIERTGGSVRFATEHKATTSLVARGSDGEHTLANLPTNIVSAPLAVQVKAHLPRSPLAFSLEYDHDGLRVVAESTLDVHRWRDFAIASLPFLDELKAFNDACKRGASIRIVLHLPGKNLTIAVGRPNLETVNRFADLLNLMAEARDVCRALNLATTLPSNLTYEHERQIRRAYGFLTKHEHRAPGDWYNFSATTKVTAGWRQTQTTPGEIRVDMKGVHDVIDFLGTSLTVDTHSVTMTEATVQVGKKKNGQHHIRFTTTTGEFIQRGTLLPILPK